MIPGPARLLADAEVERVHQASLKVLEDVGLEVNNERAREIYRRHGGVLGDDGLRVTLPPAVVEEHLRQVPQTFTFGARDPEMDRTVPGDAPLVMTASSAPDIVDPVSRRTRRATSSDVALIARLVDRLEGIDLLSVPVLADDAPADQYSVTRFYTALKHCRKPVRGSGDPGVDSESILKLAFAVAGDEDTYRAHPFLTHHYCPVISPLKMDENSTEMLIFYTEQGLPSHPTVVPNGGLTSPITLTGTLVQGNAEFLALMALTQMVRPGTPMLYSSLSTIGDMRSGAYAPGGVECGMLNMAHAQLARRYGIPCGGYVGLTNAKVCDAQAGYEKALSCMGGLLAGMHVLQFVGLVDALLAFDWSMALVDHEIALMLKRTARGMEADESSLALDDIEEVGPAGMFLTTARTLDLMKDAAFFPQVADRETRQAWEEAGATDSADRALGLAREVLETDSDTLFSPDQEARIRGEFADLVEGVCDLAAGWPAQKSSP